MQSINYKGAIHDLLAEFFSVKDGYTIGEKLEHLKKQLPLKRYYGTSDEDIYDALGKAVKTDYYSDITD